MQIIRDQQIPATLHGGIVTMGNFDGVHRGHQAIMQDVVARAQTLGTPSLAYTFHPHPAKVLAPDLTFLMIQTLEQRLRSLAATGLTATVVQAFTPEFSAHTPEAFFERIIVNSVSPKHIIVGYDFTFGHHRKGRTTDLARLCNQANIDCTIIEPVFAEEILMSSSYVRQSVAEGKMESAHQCLTRPFALVGPVVPGHGIGRQIGFPTLNIVPDNELIPPEGVYISSTTLADDVAHSLPSATYIGSRPTFGGTARVVETYILDGDPGQPATIEVAFHKRVRGDMRFHTAEELKVQIQKDVDAAREWHQC